MFCRAWLLLLLVTGGAPWAEARAEPVATVTEVSGAVRILRDQAYLIAEPGVDLEVEDIVETGPEASTQIEFRDDSMLRLGADTRVSVSEYSVDAGGGVVRATLDTLSGWLRFAVAHVREDGAYTITTPGLTVGIRGTGGVIRSGDDGGLLLEEGEVSVRPLDGGDTATAGLKVRPGEYVQRDRGGALRRQAGAPRGFLGALPAGMKNRLVARYQALPKRRIKARRLRVARTEELERYRKTHPGQLRGWRARDGARLQNHQPRSRDLRPTQRQLPDGRPAPQGRLQPGQRQPPTVPDAATRRRADKPLRQKLEERKRRRQTPDENRDKRDDPGR